MFFGCFVRGFVSGVGMMFALVPFKTCPLVRFGVCCPLLFLWLFGWFRRRRSLSLSLSFFLRRWGNPNPVSGVWDSPCVSSSRTCTSPSTRSSPCSSSPRSCPAVVFFFRRRSLVWWWLVSVCLVLVCRFSVWLGGFFVVACLVALHARHHLGRIQGAGRQDISRPISG